MIRYILCFLVFLPFSLGLWAQNTPRILIVYYSRTGNTQMVAEKLAEEFNADIKRLIDKTGRTGPAGFIRAGKDAIAGNLTEIEPLKLNPQDYDIILIGTPSWFGNVTPAVRTFVMQYDVSSRKIGLFGTTNKTGVENALNQLAGLISKDSPQWYPTLPLRSKDLKTKILDRKIGLFYQQINKE